jgi:hypothetical protein
MSRLLRGIPALAAILATAVLIGGADAQPRGPKGGKGGPKAGPKEGPKKGKDDLRKAYDNLAEVSMLVGPRGRAGRETGDLLEQARDLYRRAVKADREDEPRRADELAAAAHDAARGLKHFMLADAGAAGLPPPPSGERDDLADLLQRVRYRLEDAEDGGPGAGRAFLEAARRAAAAAGRAGRDEDYRAGELARAAEAWSHVGEHLRRAEETGRDEPPPPPDRRERPRPPRRPGRDEPPPPPRER